jgi:hypothetical protein
MPTESQLHDAALRTLVRRKLDDGRLPLDLTKTIAVGTGSGNICLACDQTITVEQVKYQAFGPKYGPALRLHWGCHVVWQLECIQRMRTQWRGSRNETLGQPRDRSDGMDPDGNLERSFYGACITRC